MFRVLRHLFKQFPLWERPAQISFIIGAVLLIVLVMIIGLSAPDDRSAPLITLFGLLFVIQLIVLWANRGLVTPYSRAQQYYLNGDFESARHLLESVAHEEDVHALTLLGNTYRQLGELEKSQEILKDLSTKHYNKHFPLYGFGRTLLVMGQYAEAADVIRRALEHGAPPAVQADLGEALYRQGLHEQAREALLTVRPLIDNEPYRALMVDYLLYRLGAGNPPDTTLIHSGLAYWTASAERFRHTPYGLTLRDDIQKLQNL